MRPRHRPLSTLPLLCLFVFCALALSNESLTLAVAGFKLSGFDLIFVAIVAVKCLRLADPDAYSLPPARIALLAALTLLAGAYLMVAAVTAPGVAAGDVARDLRIVFYFLATPFLCYKDIDSRAAYRKLQWTLVLSGVCVSTLMFAKQAAGFSTVDPVRDANLGIWVLPMSMVSILYFRQQLGLTQRAAYLLITYLFVGLVFSLNRSQYLQLAVTVAIAVALGGNTRLIRRAFVTFVPTVLAGLLVFYAIGYLDVLEQRMLSVEALDEDSSYGSRVQEYEGQLAMFHEQPIFGHGPGFRSWVMGEDGFELSTFAHNSWIFYLMKFGIVGTVVILGPSLLLMLMSLARRLNDDSLEMHRRYLIACVPAYILIDSMSAGLAYAPKTAFTGFLLCYCLSLARNDSVRRTMLYRPAAQAWPAAAAAWPPPGRQGSPGVPRPAPRKASFPRLPHHG